jgi:hypothetical protein
MLNIFRRLFNCPSPGREFTLKNIRVSGGRNLAVSSWLADIDRMKEYPPIPIPIRIMSKRAESPISVAFFQVQRVAFIELMSGGMIHLH